MIKFTMGSSDAKKTPRRKPKRTAGKSYLLPSNLSGSGSSPIAPGSNSQAPTKTVVNGCFQNTMPTSTNTFMHSLGDSLAAYSQWQQTQEVHTMTSGRVKEGDVLSSLPFNSFYLKSCFVCHRPKSGNGDLTLGQFESDSVGVDVSAYPQLWVCIECQQSFDRGGVDPMASDLQEEILLDPPSSPVLGEASESVTLNANSCNCSSCTETRQIKEQNENFEQELQQYLYEDLRHLAACIYQSSLPSLAADAHEGYQLSHIKPEKMHDLMQRFYCRDPQRLFQCLESWVEEFIMERRSGLFVQVPATGQQMTVSMASHLVTSLLNEYSCFCVIGQHLMSSFDLQENPIFKGFQLTIELHHKYLFHRLIYTELQKYLTNAVALISLQSTKLRKENTAACNFYSQLLQEYVKLQEEMTRVLMEWQEYCQLTENGKQELMDAQEKEEKMMENDDEDLARWSEIQKQTGSKLSETKTVLHVSHEGTENQLMERSWEDSIHESNKAEVNFPYPNYETCLCKYDLLAGIACSESSDVVAFPGQLLLTGCSQTGAFKNTLPSIASSTRLSSSGSASPDDTADSNRVLARFMRNPRDELCSVSDIMNGRLQTESKEDEEDEEEEDDEEEEEEDDEEDDEEEADEQDALHNSSPSHRIAELNDQFRKTTNSDDNNSSDEGDDEDDDYEDDLKRKGLRAAIRNGILRDSELSSSQASDAGILSDGSASTGAIGGPANTSIGASGGTTVSASGDMFAFGENHDAQTTTGPVQQRQQQQQPPPPCQCSSCVSQNTGSLAADLPQQPLMPSLSSLSIYPHIHGPATSGLQPLGRDPCASRTSPQRHAFPLRRQQGDGMEQLVPKGHVPESECMFPNQMMLSEWERQNSSFFVKQNNYGKVLMAASNGLSLPFTTLSLTSNAGEDKPNVDGGVWFKPDRPVVVTHSCVSSSKGVVMSSSGAFSGMSPESRVGLMLSSSNLHHPAPQVTSNDVPLFPLSMANTLPVAKYGTEQQPYCFQLPLAPLPVSTSAAAAFSSSSSFYQIAAAPALFVQPQNSCQAISISSTNSPSPHGLSSPRLHTDLMPAACMNGMAGIAKKNAVMNGASQNGSALDGSMKSCVHPDHRTSMASSTSASSLHSDTMTQFSPVANGYPSVNSGLLDYNTRALTDTATNSSAVPQAFHHSMQCQRSGSSSLPPGGSCEDQHSSGYCRSDSQQDEEGFNSQDESGSSSSNQKDGKYCDCWHCEVFGHSTPLTLPTSKNYAEMRDRLRLRLKKKNEQRTVEPEKEEEKKESAPIETNLSRQEVSHLTDIEELLKFINGEEDEAMEKSKAKAAKRSRQKLRKLQQKAKETRSDENCRRSCANNKRKNAPSPGTSGLHLLNHCTADHSCCSHKDPRSHPAANFKESSADVEGLKLLNVLNSINFNGEHKSRSDKSETSKTGDAKNQGNRESSDRVGASYAGNCEEERRRRGKMVEEGERRVTSGIHRQNGSCVSEARSTNDLRQSSSHCLHLGKMEGDLARKSKEAPQLRGMMGDSAEVREPSRVEEGMKPVTISSEDGMRTILASPLLQAELAKNKPLQKLFMQAVQQQKQSREKQKSKAAAMEAEEAEARSQQCLSTEQTINVQRDQQQRSLSKPDPMPGNRPQQTADQLGGKQKPQTIPQGRTKGVCKLPQNQPQSSAALGLKPQVILSQLNATPAGKVPQPTVHTGLAKGGKMPQEPCRISEGKTQHHQTLSHCSSAQTSQAATNGKARQKPPQQQQVSGSSSVHKDQQQSSSGTAPKSRLQSQNPPNKKQTNGTLGSPDDTTKRPSVEALNSNAAFQNGHSLSPNGLSANADIKGKPENKKTSVGYKKNKKSGGQPVQIVDDEAHLVSDGSKMPNVKNKSNLAEVNNRRTCSIVNDAPELETYMTNDHLQRINPSTTITESSDAASENNQASDCAVGGSGVATKSKKSKRKNKSKSGLSVVDEIFMPKDVPGDCHLDENEREIEEFKRFCSKSAPSENRRKVNLNNVRELFNKNVKDLFNKKKTAAGGCQ